MTVQARSAKWLYSSGLLIVGTLMLSQWPKYGWTLPYLTAKSFPDRGERAGGVLMAVKRDLQSFRRYDSERECIELVVVELWNSHDKPALLHCFYHLNTAPEPLLELNSSLQENCESTCLITLSDFNLPKLDWSSDSSAHVNTREIWEITSFNS